MEDEEHVLNSNNFLEGLTSVRDAICILCIMFTLHEAVLLVEFEHSL